LFGAESGEQEGVEGKGKGKGKSKSKGDKDDGGQRTFFEEESFDRIVLDPPCTALGIRPRLKVRVGSYAQLQNPGPGLN
jgi:hypothetical protein